MSYIVNFLGGVKQRSSGVLFTQTDTITVANTASETTLDGSGIGTKTLPANFFIEGRTLKISGMGYDSSTASPTIRIKIKFGSTVILDTTAIASVNNTNGFIKFEALITCRTTGSSGTVMGQGIFQESGITSKLFPMVNTSTTTINTTTSQVVGITAHWGAAAAGNTISLSNFLIEALN